MTAKLLVPAGAFFHDREGAMFAPAQPKPLYTCASAMVELGFSSALASVNGSAASAASGSKARQNATRIIIEFLLGPATRVPEATRRSYAPGADAAIVG